MSYNVINPYQTFYDSNGNPRANGTVTFYVNTTTTLGSIYSDEALTIAQANPYTLDASGRITGDVKYSGLMTVVEANSDGSDVITNDNVTTLLTSSLLGDLASTTDATKGDYLIGCKKTALANAVAFTLHAYNENRTINVETDYGITGSGDETTLLQKVFTDAVDGDVIHFGNLSSITFTQIIIDGKDLTLWCNNTTFNISGDSGGFIVYGR